MTDSKKMRFLMCPPDYFGVSYEINPWMKGNIGKTDPDLAKKQWNELHGIISSLAEVELLKPEPGLPDLVFTANAGLALEKEFVLSSFAYYQRRTEEPVFRKWFESQNYNFHSIPQDLYFEGGGDALFDSSGIRLWAGYGHRSLLESHPYLALIYQVEAISLRLTDPRFYHLDTCFLPLPDGYILYYPEAFDTQSNRRIESAVPGSKRIIINYEDAVSFAANAVLIEETLILNRCSKVLRLKLEALGLKVIETDLSEFLKSGGAAKCLTLNLTEELKPNRVSSSAVATRKVVAEGQLLDSQLINRICDSIVTGGGSFQIRGMHLGQKRHDLSNAEIEVTAPNADLLEELIGKIQNFGARIPLAESRDAKLEPILKDGVAPENFYSTTIYQTEVRIGGEWIAVEDQRMDGVIVVKDGKAHCRLLRNLKRGELVVAGGDGVRASRNISESIASEKFGFMSSGISSERRVELAVEQIAWDMSRIRSSGGKLVVVAGPVAIHTGGGPHLAWLARNRYISALLGGNAIAVHDIEQAFFGSSLGVDLKSGQPVQGGHRNHIASINKIKEFGSIREAVEKGGLNSGLFYELIKNGIPFSLAGSIRDDGPLPETAMDLIKAQAEYAELIKGADMILMLSSMLHSIGVGNMTPAGVKLVCVDINPAVVTKLADRGSLESVGVVTDVGLFLSALVKRLEEFG